MSQVWKSWVAPVIELLRRKPRQAFSVRIHLVILVLAAVLPLLVLTALLFWRDVQLRHEAVERGMRNTTRALSLAVDREVGSVLAVAQTLAACPDIDSRDFKPFYDLSAMAAETIKDGWVVLFDPTGQMIINTREPFGVPLPNPFQVIVKERIPTNVCTCKFTPQWLKIVGGGVFRRSSGHLPNITPFFWKNGRIALMTAFSSLT